MPETTTIARPYARAVFEQAHAKKGGLKRWSVMLQALAAVAGDAGMRKVLASPSLGGDDKVNLLLEICGQIPDVNITKEGQNFVRLLAENDRLPLLPEIAAQYETFRAEAEKTVHAELVSAFEVSDEQRTRLAEALKRRLDRDVELTVTVDDSLLGGAIIRAGDLVIDGSARGQLDRLAAALRH